MVSFAWMQSNDLFEYNEHHRHAAPKFELGESGDDLLIIGKFFNGVEALKQNLILGETEKKHLSSLQMRGDLGDDP